MHLTLSISYFFSLHSILKTKQNVGTIHIKILRNVNARLETRMPTSLVSHLYKAIVILSFKHSIICFFMHMYYQLANK